MGASLRRTLRDGVCFLETSRRVWACSGRELE